MNMERFKEQKEKIDANIQYAKTSNINKVSAIIMDNDEEVKKELVISYINEGYKVSLNNDDISILSIEW